LERLIEHLQRKGAHISVVYLPEGNGKKCGWMTTSLLHSLADLEALIEGHGTAKAGTRNRGMLAMLLSQCADRSPD